MVVNNLEIEYVLLGDDVANDNIKYVLLKTLVHSIGCVGGNIRVLVMFLSKYPSKMSLMPVKISNFLKLF